MLVLKENFRSHDIKRKVEKVMLYVGVDIAKRFHVASIVDEKTKKLIDPFDFTNTNEGFEKFYSIIESNIEDKNQCVVGMEATGHYWICLFDFLQSRGINCVVINPIQTDAFRKVDSVRKTKTDEIDETIIAKLLVFGDFIPSVSNDENTTKLRQLTRLRSFIVGETTSLKNQARALLDRLFPEYESLFSDIFGSASTGLLKVLATPDEIAKTDIRTLTRILSNSSNNIVGRKKAEALKALAKRSAGTKGADKTLAFEIRLLIERIEFSQQQVKEIEDELSKILDLTTGKYLTSIPGISTVLASTITGEIGDANRFEDPHKLIAFAGMDASRYQSGETDHTGHMSKRGSHYLRYALMQAAESARKNDPYLREAFEKKKREGKHHTVAISVVARKLCGIILVLMKQQRDYQPMPPKSSIPGKNRKA